MGEVKQKCQVPTPHEIVVQMLDQIEYSQNLYGKRVLENSCGTGNFLIEIIERYIKDCFAHNYSIEQIKFGLSRDIHAFEKDRRIHKQCINNINAVAQKYGIEGIHWNVKRKNALHAAKAHRYQFVVGNPPYLAYPELDQSTREYIRKHFSSCSKGKPDYYFAFIESALNSLAPDGKFAYLVPGNFMKNLYSERLRQLILPSLYKIVNYSHHRIFPDVLTSSVILYCDQAKQSENVHYEDKFYKQSCVIDKNQMTGKWTFNRELPNNLVKFSNYFHASAPVATQLNHAFVISRWNREDNSNIFIGKRKIEKALLRRAAGPKALQQDINEYIIFPYSYNDNGELVRYSLKQFRTIFPRGYRYLLGYRNELLSRKADSRAMWFEYGRSQLLSHLNQPKLILSSFITNQPRVYTVSAETVPYAGICVVARDGNDITRAQSILNSPEFMEYVRQVGICTNGLSYRISPTDINEFQFPLKLLEE